MMASRVRAFLRSRSPCAASTTFFMGQVCPLMPSVKPLQDDIAMPYVTSLVTDINLTFGIALSQGGGHDLTPLPAGSRQRAAAPPHRPRLGRPRDRRDRPRPGQRRPDLRRLRHPGRRVAARARRARGGVPPGRPHPRAPAGAPPHGRCPPEDGTPSDPRAPSAIDAAVDDVARQPDVAGVGDVQRSPDGRIAYVDVQYDKPSEEIRDVAYQRLETTMSDTNHTGVVRMELGGDLPTEAAQEEPGGQEFIGILVAVVVLLVAFGSVIAMGLPIGLALVGLATSVGLITLVASVVDVNSISPVLAAMIGLGVGIDYALFIVTRHRENLR